MAKTVIFSPKIKDIKAGDTIKAVYGLETSPGVLKVISVWKDKVFAIEAYGHRMGAYIKIQDIITVTQNNTDWDQ